MWSPWKQSTFFYLQQKWDKLQINPSRTHKVHVSRFSGKGTTAMTKRFVLPAGCKLQTSLACTYIIERLSQLNMWIRLSEKQCKTSKAYQKKMNNISSTKCKHGVHRVLYSHKVPRQKRDTRRVHLLEKKHSQYLRYTRQNLSSRTHAVHQLLLTDFAMYTHRL